MEWCAETRPGSATSESASSALILKCIFAPEKKDRGRILHLGRHRDKSSSALTTFSGPTDAATAIRVKSGACCARAVAGIGLHLCCWNTESEVPMSNRSAYSVLGAAVLASTFFGWGGRAVSAQTGDN